MWCTIPRFMHVRSRVTRPLLSQLIVCSAGENSRVVHPDSHRIYNSSCVKIPSKQLCRTFTSIGQSHRYSKKRNVIESEEVEEVHLDELGQDQDLFQDDYILPANGHEVLVIQPDMRRISVQFRHGLTNAEYQLAEACTLIESLPGWSVADKFRHGFTAAKYQLAEACTLKESLPGWSVADKMIKIVKGQGSRTMFGAGSFDDLSDEIRRGKYGNTAVFVSVQMLAPDQLRTMQRAWGVPVYDRFTIVLQIFKTRAKTSEAKLQVALAEIPYFRSRLKGIHMGTLDQQRGSTAYIGGSGETNLETRRRLLQVRELKIKKLLDKVQKQREFLRENRKKNQNPIIAVVGYTNAGKTSLIKTLTQDESMEPRDQLFATLDVTLHGGLLPNRMKVLYVDTVGFISDIPTSLIASFSATLEDIKHADLILHVRDISHPDTKAQKENVMTTLKSLKLPQSLTSNIIEVCNKVDLLGDQCGPLEESSNSVLISATQGLGLQQLAGRIQSSVIDITGRVVKCMKVPMSGDHLRWLQSEATVEGVRECETDTECVLVDVVITDSAYAKFKSRFGAPKLTARASVS